MTTSEASPTPPLPTTPTRSLDRSLLLGIAWTGGVKWAIQIVSWGSTIIIARLLTPGDFGIMGMASVYLGLIALIKEFGLSAAILRGRNLTEGHLAQLGGFAIGVGVIAGLISVALAYPISAFYGEPVVRTIIMLLSLTFIFTALGVLPRSLLSRDLEYRVLAWIDGGSNLVQIGTTLVFAVFGFKYYALVFGGLAGSVANALFAIACRPHRIAWPHSRREISESVHIGWHVVVGRFAWYTYQNADFAVVGRVLGKVVLGAYTVGWEIATVPVERISALVGQVTPGIFSAVQADHQALRRYYLAVVQGLSFITFPAAAGIALTAPVLVPVVLGEQWRTAILPLQLLALYGGVRSIDTVTPQVLIYTGHSRQSMWFSVLAAVVLPACFLLGARFGAAGVAATWMIGYPFVVLPTYRLAFRILDLSPSMYFRTLWPATSCTLLMAGVVLIVPWVLPSRTGAKTVLVAEMVVGAMTYAALMLLVHRGRVRAFWQLLRPTESPAT